VTRPSIAAAAGHPAAIRRNGPSRWVADDLPYANHDLFVIARNSLRLSRQVLRHAAYRQGARRHSSRAVCNDPATPCASYTGIDRRHFWANIRRFVADHGAPDTVAKSNADALSLRLRLPRTSRQRAAKPGVAPAYEASRLGSLPPNEPLKITSSDTYSSRQLLWTSTIAGLPALALVYAPQATSWTRILDSDIEARARATDSIMANEHPTTLSRQCLWHSALIYGTPKRPSRVNDAIDHDQRPLELCHKADVVAVDRGCNGSDVDHQRGIKADPRSRPILVCPRVAALCLVASTNPESSRPRQAQPRRSMHSYTWCKTGARTDCRMLPHNRPDNAIIQQAIRRSRVW